MQYNKQKLLNNKKMTPKLKNTLNDLYFIIFSTLVLGLISMAIVPLFGFDPTLFAGFIFGLIPAIVLSFITKRKRRGKVEKPSLFLEELLNYKTKKTIQITNTSSFFWNSNTKTIVTTDQTEKYKKVEVTPYIINETYTLEKFFYNYQDNDIVFLVNENNSIFFENNGLKTIRVYID